MTTHRPNIVVTGTSGAWDEETWKTCLFESSSIDEEDEEAIPVGGVSPSLIGDPYLMRTSIRRSITRRRSRLNSVNGVVALRVCMPDLRCAVTTVKQQGPEAGLRDKRKEPLNTLREIKQVHMAAPGSSANPCAFGVKLNSLNGILPGDSLTVGDTMTVIDKLHKPMSAMDFEGCKAALLGGHNNHRKPNI